MDKKKRGLAALSDWIALKLDWTTANQLTLLRIGLVPVAVWAYLNHASLWLVFPLMTFVYLLDWWDGAVSKRQEARLAQPLAWARERRMSFRERVNWRGKTRLGAMLDPLSDKMVHFGVLIPGGWDYLSRELIVLSLVVALLLTASRPLIQWLTGRNTPANRLGKTKMQVEVATVAGITLLPHTGWGYYLTSILLIAAAGLAVGSLSGQIYSAIRKEA